MSNENATCKKVPLLRMEWNFRTQEEALFINAVVIPEIEEVLNFFGVGMVKMSSIRGDEDNE